MLTGTLPREHGVVGNGWYFRELAEVLALAPVERLVAGEKVWERRARARLRASRCASSSGGTTWTRRRLVGHAAPDLPGRRAQDPGVYTQPAGARATSSQRALGPFPFFDFWGPRAGHRARAAGSPTRARTCSTTQRPTLTLVYLPHLDYDLQRLGPDDPRDRRRRCARSTRVVGELDRARAARAAREVVVLSEYGIDAGDRRRPRQPRAARGGAARACATSRAARLLDAGASRAPSRSPTTRSRTSTCATRATSREVRASARAARRASSACSTRRASARPGSTIRARASSVAVAAADRWFTYYYWLDDARAPDFARTVDIHRKPGYDPVRAVRRSRRSACPSCASRWRLAQKKLGFRYLMDVIPLDATLVKGSHGRLPDDRADGAARHLDRAVTPARGRDAGDRGEGTAPRPRVRALTRAFGLTVR